MLGAIERDVAAPVQLERISPRSLLTLIAGVAAVYLLAGQLAEVDFRTLLRSASWQWSLVALGLSAITYLGAAWSLSGFVLERLSLARTCLVQVAGSFVTLVTPAAVGGVALNIRYLRRSGVSAADSAASVGVSQLVTFVLHICLLVLFAAISGTARGHSLRPPNWVFFVIAGLLAAALAMLAFPFGRRLLRARIAPMLGQVIRGCWMWPSSRPSWPRASAEPCCLPPRTSCACTHRCARWADPCHWPASPSSI